MFNPNKLRTFIASAVIAAGTRVKLSGDNTVAPAGATDICIGTAILDNGKDSYASGAPVGVQLYNEAHRVVAADAFAVGATLRGAAAGKVTDGGADPVLFIALEAATADGDLVEAMPIQGTIRAAA